MMKSKHESYASWTKYVPFPILVLICLLSLPLFWLMGIVSGLCESTIGWKHELVAVFNDATQNQSKE